MAVKRQGNWLGQMRLDVPHLRSIESAVADDFDALAGRLMAGSQPLIVRGMSVNMTNAIGAPATSLTLNVAGSVMLHGSATEAGAIFTVPSAAAVEKLVQSNVKVSGAFVAGTANYIGIDLTRSADPATADAVRFRSVQTKKEFTQTVPLARMLGYRIVIGQNDFETSPNVAPVAKVVVDPSGNVTSVTDCRRMMFRLGSGGTSPNPKAAYTFPSRKENAGTTDISNSTNDPFGGGDKLLGSTHDFYTAIMTRLWELGGGEFWYSPTNDRDVRVTCDPTVTFADNENWNWSGTNLLWKGVGIVFGNSTGSKNTVNAQTVTQAGLTNLADGECLYADLDRTQNATISLQKGTLQNLGSPTIPGSRYVVAWRSGAYVYTRDSQKPVSYVIPRASTTVLGVVKTYTAPYDATSPVVPVVNAGGYAVVQGIAALAEDAYLDIGTVDSGPAPLAIRVGRPGTVVIFKGENTSFDGQVHVAVDGLEPLRVFATTTTGVNGTSVSGSGVSGTSTSGRGVEGVTTTGNAGVEGRALGAAAGVYGSTDAVGRSGVEGVATGGGQGVLGVSGTGAGAGVLGMGGGTGPGVRGVPNGGTGAGVEGIADSTGVGVRAMGHASRSPLNIVPQAAPLVLADGDVWVETGTDKVKARVNGSTQTLTPPAALVGGPSSLADSIHTHNGLFRLAALVNLTPAGATIELATPMSALIGFGVERISQGVVQVSSLSLTANSIVAVCNAGATTTEPRLICTYGHTAGSFFVHVEDDGDYMVDTPFVFVILSW